MVNKMISRMTLLLEAVNRCNLNCSYCYEKNRMVTNEVTENLDWFKSISPRIFNSGIRDFQIIWEGGELLLLPPSYFRQIIEIEKMWINKSIKNEIQTNLTTIDEDMIQMIKEGGFTLGISCDGPRELNDINRKGPGINSVSELIENNIELLTSSNVEFSINCVVSRSNVNRMLEVYRYFEDLELDFKISPIIPRVNLSELAITAEEYGEAMALLFNHWFSNEESKISILNFEQIIDGLLTGTVPYCEYSGFCPDHFLKVSREGKVYPCFATMKEEEIIGNLRRDTIEDILSSELLVSLRGKRKALFTEQCSICRFKTVCNGGCQRNYVKSGTGLRDYYCESHKIIFKHIEERIGGVFNRS